MTKQADKAYKLPASLDPADDICVRVYIPDDPLYVAAFWGSYEYLTRWVAWERDNSQSGKIAAERWLRSFDKAREEYLCGKGDCGVNDVRTKPNEPCTLQKQSCCDGEWVDFAVITDCTNLSPELYNDEPDEEVNDALWAIKTTLEIAHAQLIVNDPSFVKFLLGSTHLPGIGPLIDDMAAMSESERQTALDDADWKASKDAIWCDDTVCDLSDIDWYLAFNDDWLKCLVKNIISNSYEAGNRIGIWVNALLAGASMADMGALINMYPGAGSGFVWGETFCGEEFSHEWDGSSIGGSGDWTAVVGSFETYGYLWAVSTTWASDMDSAVIDPDFMVTKVEWDIDTSMIPPSTASPGPTINGVLDGGVAFMSELSPGDVVNGLQTYTWEGEEMVDKIVFGGNVNNAYWVHTTRVKIYGIAEGGDPWA